MLAASHPVKHGTDPGASGILFGLLVRMARGEEAALERFYDLTRRRIFGLALRLVGDRGAAEETTLDVYTQVWRSAASFDPTRGSIWCWLLLLTRTRALDRRRRVQRHAKDVAELLESRELTAPAPDPSKATEVSEEAVRMRAALEGLPEQQRQALEVAYFGGLSYSETAASLGLPVGTVKTRIRSGLTTLRRILSGAAEAGP